MFEFEYVHINKLLLLFWFYCILIYFYNNSKTIIITNYVCVCLWVLWLIVQQRESKVISLNDKVFIYKRKWYLFILGICIMHAVINWYTILWLTTLIEGKQVIEYCGAFLNCVCAIIHNNSYMSIIYNTMLWVRINNTFLEAVFN